MNKEKILFATRTYGCQMNVHDTEKVAALLRDGRGWVETQDAARADVLFFNTCAVRQRAEDKLYGALARLSSAPEDRRPIVVVGGCVAQLQGARLAERFPAVKVVVGPRSLHRLPELVTCAGDRNEAQVALDERGQDAFLAPAPTVSPQPARAYVTVMEGCNRVCSFCVVPRTRGPEACRPVEDVVREAERYVAAGVPELMLLGQTVNAYRWQSFDFAHLLERVAGVPGLRRLRFATSHPCHVNERVVRALTRENVCPHLHLPVQSGSDRVLEAMRRGHTRQAYLDIVALVRDQAPEVALWTDIIVGYPGETESDFDDTLALIDAVGFEGMFAFTYSPRPGTSAFRLADDVPPEVKRRRLDEVNRLQQRHQSARNAMRVGRNEEVLFEQLGGDGRLEGRNPQNRIVHCEGPAEMVGKIAAVEITAFGPNALVGRLSEVDRRSV